MKQKIFKLIVLFFVVAATAGCDSNVNDEPKEPIHFTVTFDSNGGSEVENQTVIAYNKAIEPIPTLEGHIIEGWYSDNYTFINRWNFEGNPVTSDTTLYAKWKQVFIVTFNSNGGSDITKQIVEPNNKAIEPKDVPTSEGYIFEGWYTDNYTYKNSWNFENEVTSNISLYAKWKCLIGDFPEPIKVDFEEFTTQCSWERNIYPPSLAVIDNKDELEKYIVACYAQIPSIDFSKYSLLLVRGNVFRPVYSIDCSFHQQSSNEYLLHLNVITRTGFTTSDFWHKALIINKFSRKEKIILTVSFIHPYY